MTWCAGAVCGVRARTHPCAYLRGGASEPKRATLSSVARRTPASTNSRSCWGALAMSALAAVRSQAEPYFDLDGMLYGRDNPNPDGVSGWRALQLMQHIQRYG